MAKFVHEPDEIDIYDAYMEVKKTNWAARVDFKRSAAEYRRNMQVAMAQYRFRVWIDDVNTMRQEVHAKIQQNMPTLQSVLDETADVATEESDVQEAEAVVDSEVRVGEGPYPTKQGCRPDGSLDLDAKFTEGPWTGKTVRDILCAKLG